MAKQKTESTQEGAPKKGNSGWLIAGGTILAIAVLTGFWFMGTYNSLVSMNEGVNGKWAQVETQYQRRFDLINNLISTVKGQTKAETDLLLSLTQLNTQWQAAVGANQKVAAANQLDTVLKSILVAPPTTYPALTQAAGFQDFRDELANTENKVAVERGRYNDAVRDFNARVKLFPTNMVAGMFGFASREYFQAAEGTQNAPAVSFP